MNLNKYEKMLKRAKKAIRKLNKNGKDYETIWKFIRNNYMSISDVNISLMIDEEVGQCCR